MRPFLFRRYWHSKFWRAAANYSFLRVARTQAIDGHIHFTDTASLLVSFGCFQRLALQRKTDLLLALIRHNLGQREGARDKLCLQRVQPLGEHYVERDVKVAARDAAVAPLGHASASDDLYGARVDHFVNL